MMNWSQRLAALPSRPYADSSGYAVGSYNDAGDTTHADIMALFDRAIAAAERSK